MSGAGRPVWAADPAGAGVDHEALLVGALLQRPDLAAGCGVQPEHYYRPLYALLHQVIADTAAAHGQDADLVRVLDTIRGRPDAVRIFNQTGNGAHLFTLAGTGAAVASLDYYAEHVLTAWRMRALGRAGQRLVQLAEQTTTNGTDPGDALEQAMCELVAVDKPTTAAPGWDTEPVPLSPHRLLPAFPTDALPGWLADQVAALAEFTQTPPDLPGCLALACLSAAAGGRAVVEVRPGWREPVNLYTVVALTPGSRKSAVFAAMTAPLLAAEQTLTAHVRPQIAEAEVSARVARAHAEHTARTAEAAATAQARVRAMADACTAALAADEVGVPVLPRLVADDITAEAAASLLAEQRGRLAVLSAEGGIFTTLAGRYTSGTPNLETFLKGHAGDLLRVDRKGRPPECYAPL